MKLVSPSHYLLSALTLVAAADNITLDSTDPLTDGKPPRLLSLNIHAGSSPLEDKVEPRLRTERILFGEGDELLDVGHQSIRLDGAGVHLIFALYYNDKKPQGQTWT